MPDTLAPVVPQLSPRPIPGAELERRRAENAELIELARPHLEWLSAAHRDVAHMVALVDRDGVILHSLARQLDANRTPRVPGMGAPVKLANGETIGAIRLHVATDNESASRLLVVAHTAFAIAQELKLRAQVQARAA